MAFQLSNKNILYNNINKNQNETKNSLLQNKDVAYNSKLRHQLDNFHAVNSTSGSPAENFSAFEKRLMMNQDLVTVDMTLPQPNSKNKEIIPFKKKYQMNSYVEKYNKHRENLTIPELPKVKKPVDISKNIIETKPKIETMSIKIQSDEFIEPNLNHPININTNNSNLNKQKANKDPHFNLYLEKNKQVFVEDTRDYDLTHNLKTEQFMQQKTGKDVSTQIEDGELFCFDIDVEPLLTVVTNKILEQALLELSEEQEIKNLRESKLKYWKKLHDEKAVIKKIELEELNRKREIENLKKVKYRDKANKVFTQQKLLARVNAKTYLSNLKTNTIKYLITGNIFCNFKDIIIKESTLKNLSVSSRKMNINENELEKTVTSMVKDSVDNMLLGHRDILNNRKAYLEKLRLEELERQKLLDAEKEIARIEREKKRQVKRIKKLKNDIKRNVLKAANIKNEYYMEDILNISGPDDYNVNVQLGDEKGEYVGVLGGLIMQLLATMTVLRTEIFSLNDSYFTQEVINEVFNNYLNESGKIVIKLSSEPEAEIKALLLAKANESIGNLNNSVSNQNISNTNDLDEFNLSTLKENPNLTKDDWNKVSDILSKPEHCNEPHLKSIFKIMEKNDEEYYNSLNDKKKSQGGVVNNLNPCSLDEFKKMYEMIVKALFSHLEKGNEKIVLSFSPPENLDKYYSNLYSKKKAFCLISTHENMTSILDIVDYSRDKKTKKLKIPNIEIEARLAKVYQTKVDYINPNTNINYGYTVLLEDTYAEFFVSMKFVECFLRIILGKFDNEIDCKNIYIRFYELFVNIIDFSRKELRLSELIQFFDFDYYQEDDDEDMSNVEGDSQP